MKPDNLDGVVAGILDDFFNVAIEDMREAAKEAGKTAVKMLKSSSPGKKRKYAKAWRMKEDSPRTGVSVVVYNKDTYMLAHLLEYGHPKTNGGRVPGTVHIKPAETEAMKIFEQELKRRIENDA